MGIQKLKLLDDLDREFTGSCLNCGGCGEICVPVDYTGSSYTSSPCICGGDPITLTLRTYILEAHIISSSDGKKTYDPWELLSDIDIREIEDIRKIEKLRKS